MEVEGNLVTTARADRREPRLEHHHDPKAPPVDLAPHPPPSWSSSRCGLIPRVVLGAQCPQREETRYWTPAVRGSAPPNGSAPTKRTPTPGVSSDQAQRSPESADGGADHRAAQSPTCASVRGHRRRKVQNDRPDDGDEEHESDRDEYRHVVGPPGERPGTRSTPSLARPSAPSPRIARTTAVTSRILPAVSTRLGYRHDPPGTDRSRFSFPPPAIGSWGLAVRRPVANAHDFSLAHAHAHATDHSGPSSSTCDQRSRRPPTRRVGG